MMQRIGALLILVTLAGCVTPSGSPTQRSNVSFGPDSSGLSVDPIGKRVDFGRSPEGVIRLLDRELGKHQAVSLAGCPTGITQQKVWGDLVLTFTRERFVGWRTSEAAQGQVCA